MTLDLSGFRPLAHRDELRALQPALGIWEDDLGAFHRQHRGSAHATVEPLYALPRGLLEALRAEEPDWFTPEELAFELELEHLCQRHAVIGAFLGKMVTDNALLVPSSPWKLEEAFRAFNWGQYGTLETLRAGARIAAERMDGILPRLGAYRGWLVTNPQYLEDVRELRRRWEPSVRELGRIPAYPVSADDVPGNVPQGMRVVTVSAGFAEAWNGFYARWDLQRLITWDLPESFGPNLSGAPLPPSVARPSGQITLQVPAVCALPGNFSLGAVIAEAQHAARPEHLRGWDEVCQQKHPRGLRFESFRQLFLLHFYRDVVLHSRYADRFKNRVGRLDRIFGVFLGGLGDAGSGPLNEETAKKLRHHMTALRRPGNSAD